MKSKGFVTRKATRLAQRTQTLTRGYFGGYIAKAQPAGHMERATILKKIERLRLKGATQSDYKKHRQVSETLCRTLEKDCVAKGAVEVANLQLNMRKNDALNAECIRTFPTYTLDGRMWLNAMQRLCLDEDGEDALSVTYDEFVMPAASPKIAKPSKHWKPNEYFAYGFRPRDRNGAFWLLSAYEFLRDWCCVPLLPPDQYPKGTTPRTKWTQKGRELSKTPAYKEGIAASAVPMPWEHFVLDEEVAGEARRQGVYYTFPEYGGKDEISEETTAYRKYRHSCVLERKKRPDVVIIEGLRRPSAKATKTYNSQYQSLFFRPWTLHYGCAEVPHLKLLGLPQTSLTRVYKMLTTVQDDPGDNVSSKTKISEDVDWTTSWENYVRGHVVSERAAAYIKTFLLQTQVGGGDDNEEEDEDNIPEPDKDMEMPSLNLNKADFQNLLACEDEVHDDKEGTLAEKLVEDAKKVRKESKNAQGYIKSKILGRCIWSTENAQSSAADRICEVTNYDYTFEEHLRDLVKKPAVTKASGPYGMHLDVRAVYEPGADCNVNNVLADILRGEGNPAVMPNERQKAFLKHFVARLSEEAASPEVCRSEPLLDCVHGPPGTGILYMLRS